MLFQSRSRVSRNVASHVARFLLFQVSFVPFSVVDDFVGTAQCIALKRSLMFVFLVCESPLPIEKPGSASISLGHILCPQKYVRVAEGRKKSEGSHALGFYFFRFRDFSLVLAWEREGMFLLHYMRGPLVRRVYHMFW